MVRVLVRTGQDVHLVVPLGDADTQTVDELMEQVRIAKHVPTQSCQLGSFDEHVF